MEDIIKKPTYNYIPHSTPASPLAMHKNSQTISKTKPKIRIIHIFAPEIIKTDVENFRELVQRLTGKPSDHNHQKGCKKRPSRNPRREEEPRSTSSVLEKPVMVAKKVELRSTFIGLEAREKVKEEEEEEEEMMMWNGANSGGFLNGFADFDGLIQELGEFPLLPMDASHHMHGLI